MTFLVTSANTLGISAIGRISMTISPKTMPDTSGSFIVVNGTVNSKMDTIHYEVIDGQQRLTTLSLLLAAIYARVMEHKDSIDDDLMLDDVRPLRNRLILKSDKSRTRVIPQVQNHNLEDYRWILRNISV